jgi:hypothetical protein
VLRISTSSFAVMCFMLRVGVIPVKPPVTRFAVRCPVSRPRPLSPAGLPSRR